MVELTLGTSILLFIAVYYILCTFIVIYYGEKRKDLEVFLKFVIIWIIFPLHIPLVFRALPQSIKEIKEYLNKKLKTKRYKKVKVLW